MATLLCRYLLNEGAGTTIADSSGNGYDLTFRPGSNGGWSDTDMANGTSIYSTQTYGSVTADNPLLPQQQLESSTNNTMVLAVENLVGHSNMMRCFSNGTPDDGSGYSLCLGVNQFQMRWYGEPSWAGAIYRWSDFTTVGGMTANMVVIIDTDMSRAELDRHRLYLNNNLVTVSSSDSRSDRALPDDLTTWYTSLIGRATTGSRSIQGNIGYAELWAGSLTAQERADCTANLLLDCDTSWQGGGPPTSVSFTAEPSATNIDTDRVTANATAESDAP